MPVFASKLKKQKGMALIVAIMIVALVTAVSVEILWRFNLYGDRHSNRLHGVQGRAYLDALEDFARNVIKQDSETSPEVDTLAEDWAQQAPPFDTDLGYVGGRLEDAQGRFILSSLQEPVTLPKGIIASQWFQRYTPPQRRFIRLLQTVEIGDGQLVDQTTAENITDAIIDWMDPDSEPTGFGGAEGDYYSRLDVPVTIPNSLMASVSELLLIKGMTPKIYEALLPLVIALPGDINMNINTMPPALLRMFNTRNNPMPLSPEDAQILIDARGIEGFQNIDDFKNFPEIVSLLNTTVDNNVPGGNDGNKPNQKKSPRGFDDDGLGVNTSYFIFYGQAMVTDHMYYTKSLLAREGEEVITVRRTDSNF